MSINEIITAALVPLGDVVEYEVYTGQDIQYYTFNSSAYGDDFGDDEPGHERYLVQVHFFCPLTYKVTPRIAQTKQVLFAAGFTWPSVVDASDVDARHIVFECEYMMGVDVDG